MEKAKMFFKQVGQVLLGIHTVGAGVCIVVHVWSQPFTDQSLLILGIKGVLWPYYLPHFFGWI